MSGPDGGDLAAMAATSFDGGEPKGTDTINTYSDLPDTGAWLSVVERNAAEQRTSNYLLLNDSPSSQLRCAQTGGIFKHLPNTLLDRLLKPSSCTTDDETMPVAA